MNEIILNNLKNKAKEVLDENTRFHCYGHALEVLENAIKLIEIRGVEKIDKDSLYAAALLHDASNSQDKKIEGIEGAEIAGKVLKKIKNFPQEKIKDVKRLIISIDEDREKTADELIINAADEMAAFSDLGLVRSLMMCGGKGMKVKEAIEDELAFLEKRFSGFKMEEARDLVKNQYQEKKKLLTSLLNNYP